MIGCFDGGMGGEEDGYENDCKFSSISWSNIAKLACNFLVIHLVTPVFVLSIIWATRGSVSRRVDSAFCLLGVLFMTVVWPCLLHARHAFSSALWPDESSSKQKFPSQAVRIYRLKHGVANLVLDVLSRNACYFRMFDQPDDEEQIDQEEKAEPCQRGCGFYQPCSGMRSASLASENSWRSMAVDSGPQASQGSCCGWLASWLCCTVLLAFCTMQPFILLLHVAQDVREQCGLECDPAWPQPPEDGSLAVEQLPPILPEDGGNAATKATCLAPVPSTCEISKWYSLSANETWLNSADVRMCCKTGCQSFGYNTNLPLLSYKCAKVLVLRRSAEICDFVGSGWVTLALMKQILYATAVSDLLVLGPFHDVFMLALLIGAFVESKLRTKRCTSACAKFIDQHRHIMKHLHPDVVNLLALTTEDEHHGTEVLQSLSDLLKMARSESEMARSESEKARKKHANRSLFQSTVTEAQADPDGYGTSRLVTSVKKVKKAALKMVGLGDPAQTVTPAKLVTEKEKEELKPRQYAPLSAEYAVLALVFACVHAAVPLLVRNYMGNPAFPTYLIDSSAFVISGLIDVSTWYLLLHGFLRSYSELKRFLKRAEMFDRAWVFPGDESFGSFASWYQVKKNPDAMQWDFRMPRKQFESTDDEEQSDFLGEWNNKFLAWDTTLQFLQFSHRGAQRALEIYEVVVIINILWEAFYGCGRFWNCFVHSDSKSERFDHCYFAVSGSVASAVNMVLLSILLTAGVAMQLGFNDYQDVQAAKLASLSQHFDLESVRPAAQVSDAAIVKIEKFQGHITAVKELQLISYVPQSILGMKVTKEVLGGITTSAWFSSLSAFIPWTWSFAMEHFGGS